MESIKFAENLAMFVDVAQAGSFSAVARRKGLVASSVARQIDALESDLKVVLFTRSTRALVTTDAGELLLARAVKILHAMSDVRSEVASLDRSVQGLLRVACVPAFGRRHVVPHLGSLFAKHPGLSVELELTERAVDAVVERFDVVIRVGEQPDSSLVSRRIGSQRYIIGASPAYLERYGRPTHFHELSRHRLIDRQHSTSMRGWREIEGDGAWQPSQFALECDDCDARRLSAAQGLGIALMPNWAIGEDLAAGRLVALDLAGAPPQPESGIYLLRAAPRANSRTRAFTQHLIGSIGRSASWIQDAANAA
ncbi:LysR family transcriptional regulator [Rhodoferax koreense]|uniref:LysR family transcriptional regulator n=1 Tax=Rhodoferax koreensis TaxID=1842727 RepID=A0A1P8JS17_9BURK|nr:LysR family transcriptional regulator [Rhodoferax koreense]APW36546.1 LysR family transcriptional regulator [Rhodoferax koreense]